MNDPQATNDRTLPVPAGEGSGLCTERTGAVCGAAVLPVPVNCERCAGGLAEVERLIQGYKKRGHLIEALAAINAKYAFIRGMKA